MPPRRHPARAGFGLAPPPAPMPPGAATAIGVPLRPLIGGRGAAPVTPDPTRPGWPALPARPPARSLPPGRRAGCGCGEAEPCPFPSATSTRRSRSRAKAARHPPGDASPTRRAAPRAGDAALAPRPGRRRARRRARLAPATRTNRAMPDGRDIFFASSTARPSAWTGRTGWSCRATCWKLEVEEARRAWPALRFSLSAIGPRQRRA